MKTFPQKKILIFLLTVFVLIFNSCLGLSMDIQLNKNGSGKLIMEYKISNTLAGIGTLDGNANWPIIPVGKSDWERTLTSVKGAKLSSFSASEQKQDIVYKAVIDFDNPDVLLKLIDPTGSGSSINMKGEFNIFFNIADENLQYDDIKPFLNQMFTGYEFLLSFSAPSNSTMTITDANGKTVNLPPSAKIVNSGKKVSLTMGMDEFINISENIFINFKW